LPEQSALLERLHHQRNVALFEVAHAAVHELGASARRALAEVVLLEEQDVVAAARGIDSDAHAGRAAPDDDNVPGIAPLVEPCEHVGPAHGWRPTGPARP